MNKEKLKQLKEKVETARSYWRDNYDTAKENNEFLYSSQWSKEAIKQRREEGRPYFEINRLPIYIGQVVGDMTKSPPSINVIAVQDDNQNVANLAGTKDYSIAEVYEGIIKNIEKSSKAQHHYRDAFKQALEFGIGWLLVSTEYDSETTFDQKIKVSSVYDPLSVLIDPNTMEPDCSDAEYAIVLEKLTLKEFNKKYPNKSTSSVEYGNNDRITDWITEDLMTVADVYEREKVRRDLLMLSDGRTVWKDEVEAVLDELGQNGITVIRDKTVETYKVYHYRISGADILEDKQEFPSNTVPVVPVFGRAFIGDDNKKHYVGLTHFAQDAQRVSNHMFSAAVEKIDQSPKSPFIADSGAIQGYEEMWQNANERAYSTLIYREGKQMPQRLPGSPLPSAELQGMATAVNLVKDTTGIYDAGIGAPSNEQSGRAILARQQESDTNVYDFIVNLNMAVERVGKICVNLIPKIYDAQRTIRIRFPDGGYDSVTINQTVVDEQTGEEVLVNDISVGAYDINIKTGPTYQSERMENAERLIQLMQANPQIGQIGLDVILESLDFQGAQVIAERMKKQLPPEMLSQEDREKLEKERQESVDPQANEAAQMQQAIAEKQQQLAEAKIQSEIGLNQTKAQVEQGKLQLEATKIQAELNSQKAIQSFTPEQLLVIQKLIAEGIGEAVGAINQN